MKKRRTEFSLAIILFLFIFLGGCTVGTGSSSNPPPPPNPSPNPDFSITVSPGTVSAPPGGASNAATVSVMGMNGFTGQTTVSVTGLPQGATVTPTQPFAVAAGATQQISIAVPTGTAPGNVALTVTGTSGQINHSAPLALMVTAPGANNGTPRIHNPPALPAEVSADIIPLPDPSGYTERSVCASGCDFSSLQPALDFAEVNCGTTGVMLTLQAGETFDTAVGYTIGATNCAAGKWVVIRSSAHAFLPAAPTGRAKGTPWGRRVTPADGPNMATLRAIGINVTLFQVDVNVDRVRLVGLRFTDFGVASTSAHIAMGHGGSPQNSAAAVPTQIVVDRCWLTGSGNSINTHRSILMECNDCAVLNSRIEKIGAVGQQNQGIVAWNSNGPKLIQNNFISAAGMNIFFGGADALIPNSNVEDVGILGNHLAKDNCWNPNESCYYGVAYDVVNTIESKKSKRVLVQGNFMENVWPDVQTGSFYTLKSENQSGGDSDAETSDWMIRYNRHTNGYKMYDLGPRVGTFSSVPGKRWAFHDNLFFNMRASATYRNVGLIAGAGPLADFGFVHNTLVFNSAHPTPPGWQFLVFDVDTGAYGALPRGAFHSNLMGTAPTNAGGNVHINCEVGAGEPAWGCFDSNASTADGEDAWFNNIALFASETNGCGSTRFESTYSPYALHAAAACLSTLAAVGFVDAANQDYDLCVGVGNPSPTCGFPSPAVGAGIAHDGTNYIGANMGRPNGGAANTVYGETCGAMSGDWACYR